MACARRAPPGLSHIICSKLASRRRPHSEAGLGFLFLFLPFFPLPHSPFFLKGLVRFLPSSATALCASPLSSRSPAMSPAPIRAISEPPQIAAPSPSLPDRGGRSPGARFQPALSSQRSFIPGSTTPRRFSSLRHCPPERSPLFSLWPNVGKETPAPLPPLSLPSTRTERKNRGAGDRQEYPPSAWAGKMSLDSDRQHEPASTIRKMIGIPQDAWAWTAYTLCYGQIESGEACQGRELAGQSGLPTSLARVGQDPRVDLAPAWDEGARPGAHGRRPGAASPA